MESTSVHCHCHSFTGPLHVAKRTNAAWYATKTLFRVFGPLTPFSGPSSHQKAAGRRTHPRVRFPSLLHSLITFARRVLRSECCLLLICVMVRLRPLAMLHLRCVLGVATAASIRSDRGPQSGPARVYAQRHASRHGAMQSRIVVHGRSGAHPCLKAAARIGCFLRSGVAGPDCEAQTDA
jgi:hypothetical protein